MANLLTESVDKLVEKPVNMGIVKKINFLENADSEVKRNLIFRKSVVK